MKFLKFLGGVVLAIAGVVGLLITVLGSLSESLAASLEGTPFTAWPFIAIGIVSFVALVGGIFLARSDR